MYTSKQIELASLLIDTNNPRLEEVIRNQRDAIRAIASNQKEKLVILAGDIVEFGLNPSDYPIVIPFEEDIDRYLTIEGNRRVATIKILENPELISGVVSTKIVDRFKKLSKKYLKSPIVSVNCILYESREEAEHWITLRHTGENKGAGIVKWGGAEIARFRERAGKKEPSLQILDFLEKEGALSKQTRNKVPITSLRRIIGTPYVRTKLGIDLIDGKIQTRYENDEIINGIKRIVEDLATGIKTVKDIYRKEDRIRYIDEISAHYLPNTTKPSTDFRPLDSEIPSSEKENKKKIIQPSSYKRPTLIPRGTALEIGDVRINNIYHELRKLKIDIFANAISVLFRVFLELSLDWYIIEKKLEVTKKTRTLKGADAIDATLRQKLLAVHDYMKDQRMLTKQQLSPVNRAAQKDSFFASDVYALNAYVHNNNFSPSPGDLRVAWDNLQPFIEAIWA
ncbi:MAG: hypothetical protein ACFFG0_12430 [Candidatus Thorarchaeota archaeon]